MLAPKVGCGAGRAGAKAGVPGFSAASVHERVCRQPRLRVLAAAGAGLRAVHPASLIPPPLAAQAIMMVAAGLGFQLPLCAHLRVHSIALTASLAATWRRCSYECALAAPRQVHERAARALAAGVGKVFPLAGSQGLGALPPLAGPLPCLLVQAWLQVTVGFLIPTLFIDATAAKPVMWHVPLRRGGVQTLFLVQRAGPLLCWYLGLLAVAAVVWWQALALGAGALVGLLARAAG